MGLKEAHEKLSFTLRCRYYATPDETEQCLVSLNRYLDLEKHRKRLSAWTLLAAGIRTDGPGMSEKTVRIVMFDVKFTHKWMTLENLGLARCTFMNATRVIRDMMGGLAKASVQERGTLEWSKVFCYDCHPRRDIDCKRGWGIEGMSTYCHPHEQAGANGSVQKSIQELLISYMETPDRLRGTKFSLKSSRRTLEEARRRLDGAEGNIRPLWKAFYCTSVLCREPLQLDIDLAIFTMNQVARGYDELLALFKVVIQSKYMVSRVNKAADLGESLSLTLNGGRADVDDASVTSDSEKTIFGDDDYDVEKTTVVEIENAYKPAAGGFGNQQPHRRNWWRRVLNLFGIKVRYSTREPQPADSAVKLRERSLEIRHAHAELSERVVQFAAQFDQLRVLAKGFNLLTNIQTKWAQVQALAKRPGVDMAEVNKVTAVNIVELSIYPLRLEALRKWADKVKEANKAMMQDAASIVQRSKQLEKDLDDLFRDHRAYRGRFSGFVASKKCSA